MLQANVTPLVIAQQFRCHARTIECLKKCFWQIRTMSDCVPSGRHPQGDSHIFSIYVGWDPASTIHPQKNIRIFKHPKKIFEILATQKNIPILYLDLKKRP